MPPALSPSSPHPNSQNLHLVFEFMDSDLEKILHNSSVSLSLADVKAYMLGLLQGVAQCHAEWVLHRDIKVGPSAQLEKAPLSLSLKVHPECIPPPYKQRK